MKLREREAAALLYIEGQKTLDEIAEQLPVSVRSLKTWRREHGWEQKRQDFIAVRSESVELCRKSILDLEREIAEDRKKGRKPSTSRLYALAAFQKRVESLQRGRQKDAEATIEAPIESKKPPLSVENFLKIEEEEFRIFTRKPTAPKVIKAQATRPTRPKAVKTAKPVANKTKKARAK